MGQMVTDGVGGSLLPPALELHAAIADNSAREFREGA